MGEQRTGVLGVCALSGPLLRGPGSLWSKLKRGGIMRRLIVIAIWMLVLTWLLAWMRWSTDRGELPSGAIWAVSSLGAWWLLGASSREGKRRG
jgi:hypothetical protein